MKKLTCDYCGKEKEEFSFFIGASRTRDWTMHEGTGKVSCPDCYNEAEKEATARIDAHIKAHNKSVTEKFEDLYTDAAGRCFSDADGGL